MEEHTDEWYQRNAALYAQALLMEGKTLEELETEKQQRVEWAEERGLSRSYRVEGCDMAIALRTR